MTTNLKINETQLLEPGFQEQTLTLLIPFEPKITAKSKIENMIRRMVDEAERQMLERLPKAQAKLVLAQVRLLLAGLDYGTHKKSLALIATPFEGKIYYWNIPVQEAIFISKEFPVRQLLAKKKEEKEYLLLAMGDHYAGIYLGNGNKLSRLVANSPAPVHLHNEAAPESQQHKSAVKRAVRHIDDALAILLRSYRFPVFIVAPAEHLECFRQISRTSKHTVALIEGTPDGSEKGLLQVMAPHLANWQVLKEKALVQRLEHALQSGKLAVGISEVWKAANERKARLMVVEEDYVYPAYLDHKDGIMYADAIPINQAARQETDAVADAVEKVLADGGIVEVVRKGVLSDFVHVAAIYY